MYGYGLIGTGKFICTLELSFKYVFPLIINPDPPGDFQQFVSLSPFSLCKEPLNWLISTMEGTTSGSSSLFTSRAGKEKNVKLISKTADY